MPAYEIGITEINTQIRRLGYVSAILSILSNKTLSEALLYERLERWSEEHEQDLMSYSNSQGQIKSTRGRTGAKRYTEFAVSLGLVGRIAHAYRITRFGKMLQPFIALRKEENGFKLCVAERQAYLYWLLAKDADRSLTVLDMLSENKYQPLALLQKNFQSRYLDRLDIRSNAENARQAREIKSIRNKVAIEWKSAIRYAENIVPPRIHWFLDLGLAEILDTRGKPAGLTLSGKKILEQLPQLGGSNLSNLDLSWLKGNYFGCISPILVMQQGRCWSDVDEEERRKKLVNIAFRAFDTLRSSPARKISLYPTLIYISLQLATHELIWANLDEVLSELNIYSKSPDHQFEVRFSNRENESYLIWVPS